MDRIEVVAVAVSAGLCILVFELVRRRKLSEEYSLIWIVCAVALVTLTLARRRFDALALWLGIYYPPALLLLLVIFIVFVVSLYFSLAISRQREQIERLIEEVTILAAVQREHGASERHHAGDHSPERPSAGASQPTQRNEGA
jgi:hypothetical protein